MGRGGGGGGAEEAYVRLYLVPGDAWSAACVRGLGRREEVELRCPVRKRMRSVLAHLSRVVWSDLPRITERLSVSLVRSVTLPSAGVAGDTLLPLALETHGRLTVKEMWTQHCAELPDLRGEMYVYFFYRIAPEEGQVGEKEDYVRKAAEAAVAIATAVTQAGGEAPTAAATSTTSPATAAAAAVEAAAGPRAPPRASPPAQFLVSPPSMPAPSQKKKQQQQQQQPQQQQQQPQVTQAEAASSALTQAFEAAEPRASLFASATKANGRPPSLQQSLQGGTVKKGAKATTTATATTTDAVRVVSYASTPLWPSIPPVLVRDFQRCKRTRITPTYIGPLTSTAKPIVFPKSQVPATAPALDSASGLVPGPAPAPALATESATITTTHNSDAKNKSSGPKKPETTASTGGSAALSTGSSRKRKRPRPPKQKQQQQQQQQEPQQQQQQSEATATATTAAAALAMLQSPMPGGKQLSLLDMTHASLDGFADFPTASRTMWSHMGGGGSGRGASAMLSLTSPAPPPRGKPPTPNGAVPFAVPGGVPLSTSTSSAASPALGPLGHMPDISTPTVWKAQIHADQQQQRAEQLQLQPNLSRQEQRIDIP